jgi:hypothetical protein
MAAFFNTLLEGFILPELARPHPKCRPEKRKVRLGIRVLQEAQLLAFSVGEILPL